MAKLNIMLPRVKGFFPRINCWTEGIDSREKLDAFLQGLGSFLSSLTKEKRERLTSGLRETLEAVLLMDIPCDRIDLKIDEGWVCAWGNINQPVTSFFYTTEHGERNMTSQQVVSKIARSIGKWIYDNPAWADKDLALKKCEHYIIWDVHEEK